MEGGCFGEGCGHLFAPMAPYCASAQCLLYQQPLAPFPCLTHFCPSFLSSPHFLRCTLMLLPREASFPLSLTQALCSPHSSPPRSRHSSSCLLLPLEDLLLGSQLLCLITLILPADSRPLLSCSPALVCSVDTGPYRVGVGQVSHTPFLMPLHWLLRPDSGRSHASLPLALVIMMRRPPVSGAYGTLVPHWHVIDGLGCRQGLLLLVGSPMCHLHHLVGSHTCF